MEDRRSRLARTLAHPLTITLASAVLAAIVLPLVTREWQDRRDELELKRGLVERVAESSTTAVRHGISYVEQQLGLAPEGGQADIAVTYRNWLVERSVTSAVVATYFPSLESCWFDYSNTITTLLELATATAPSVSTRGISNALIRTDADCGWTEQVPEAARQRLDRLRESLVRNGLLLDRTTDEPPVVTRRTLRLNYSDLGELLLLGKDGIVRQIVATPARGYYHGLL